MSHLMILGNGHLNKQIDQEVKNFTMGSVFVESHVRRVILSLILSIL